MRISDELLGSFIDIYRQKYGRILTRDDAYARAIRLLRLMKVVNFTYRSERFQKNLARRECGMM